MCTAGVRTADRASEALAGGAGPSEGPAHNDLAATPASSAAARAHQRQLQRVGERRGAGLDDVRARRRSCSSAPRRAPPRSARASWRRSPPRGRGCGPCSRPGGPRARSGKCGSSALWNAPSSACTGPVALGDRVHHLVADAAASPSPRRTSRCRGGARRSRPRRAPRTAPRSRAALRRTSSSNEPSAASNW